MRPDYHKHFALGAAISMPTVIFLWAFFLSVIPAAVIGLVMSAIAGVVKDCIWDLRMGRGTFELADIGFTILGGIVGIILALAIIKIP
jgi:hypothetical protein